MNRKIKFKLWNPGDQDMLEDISLFNYADSPFITDGTDVALQFTNFTDINGKEIYEGDILGDWVGTETGPVQSAKQVYWCSKKGAWKLDSGFKQNKAFGDLLGKELRSYDYEVLGNIYQNPELLNPK